MYVAGLNSILTLCDLRMRLACSSSNFVFVEFAAKFVGASLMYLVKFVQ